MAELTITNVEVAKEMPDWQDKGATVYRLTVEGDDRQPEKFVPSDQPAPQVGETIEGIENSDYGPKVMGGKKKGGGGGGGKSPVETKRIVRQHSQEMALRREQNLLAAGGSLLTDSQMTELIGWFEADAYGKQKQGVITGVNTSDVPVDTEGLP